MANELDACWQVRDLYSALNTQDLDLLDSIVSEQIEFTDYALGETLKGKKAFRNYYMNWWTAFPKGSGKIHRMVVSNNVVVVEAVGRGIQAGPFQTRNGRVEPTQQLFEFHFCQVFHIKHDQIVSGHSYSDAFKLAEQLIGDRNETSQAA